MEHRIAPELLTIILTTSPTPSAPSPELVASVLASLPTEVLQVPVIVTFDGYTISKGSRIDGRLKKGQIPEAMALEYSGYIENVQGLFGPRVSPEIEDLDIHAYVSHTTDHSTRHSAVTFLRQKFRQGFGFSVRSALQHCSTPNVLVLQHDWVFCRPLTPLSQLLDILHHESEVNYITFIARQSLRYEVSRGESLGRYKAVFQAARKIREGRLLGHELHACLHIFDRPHLCKVAVYRRILSNKVLRRGDFIEDTVGTEYLKAIARSHSIEESIAAWRTVGAWMYYEGSGDVPTIRHTSGRTVLSAPLQAERIKAYIRDNQSRKVVVD